MKKSVKVLALGLTACMLFALAGCAKSGLKQKDKLIMATNAEFEPFEYMDSGKIVGIDVDMATQIAKDMGVTLDVENMNFDSVIPSVVSGKMDIGVAGISKTPDREKSVDFSEAYYDASQVIIVKKDNTAVTGQDALKGKKIAVQKGTTGDDLASKLTSDANMERFNASTDAVTELKNGKVDAVIIDSFPAKVFVKQNSDLKIAGQPLTSESYCIAVKKGNATLLKKINASIEKMKSDGTLENILKKYS